MRMESTCGSGLQRLDPHLLAELKTQRDAVLAELRRQTAEPATAGPDCSLIDPDEQLIAVRIHSAEAIAQRRRFRTLLRKLQEGLAQVRALSESPAVNTEGVSGTPEP